VPLMAGAEPFASDAGPVGALVLHGFTGSPKSMRPWAERLATEGLTVRLPRLPGHGSSWRDLALTRWEDWYGEADRAFGELTRSCAEVFVMALSMGGTLALRLAEQHGPQVRGLVLVNPSVHSENKTLRALPLLKSVVPSVPGIGNDIAKPGQDEGCYDRVPLKALHSLTQLWAQVRQDITRVDQPLLLFRSLNDHVVEPSNAAWLLTHVSSTDLEERLLPSSNHVATLDNDAPAILDGSVEFVRRLTVTDDAEPAGT
jgi:carboxylesterase